MRAPQSSQSVPSRQKEYSAPGPPSSQSPSDAYLHASAQRPTKVGSRGGDGSDGGEGGVDGSAGGSGVGGGVEGEGGTHEGGGSDGLGGGTGGLGGGIGGEGAITNEKCAATPRPAIVYVWPHPVHWAPFQPSPNESASQSVQGVPDGSSWSDPCGAPPDATTVSYATSCSAAVRLILVAASLLDASSPSSGNEASCSLHPTVLHGTGDGGGDSIPSGRSHRSSHEISEGHEPAVTSTWDTTVTLGGDGGVAGGCGGKGGEGGARGGKGGCCGGGLGGGCSGGGGNDGVCTQSTHPAWARQAEGLAWAQLACPPTT